MKLAVHPVREGKSVVVGEYRHQWVVPSASNYLRSWIMYQKWLNGPLWRYVIRRITELGSCRCDDVEGPHRHYRRSL